MVAVVLLVAALVAYCTVRDDREEALRSERATTISGDGGGAAVSEKHVADATHSGPIDEQRGRAHRSRFVVTTDSGVVSEARVLLPDQGVEGTTNHQGEVVLLHSREARKYIVRKIGYRTVFGNTWGAETVRVTLATGQPARGRVVLAGSGAPAEGARVSVRTLDNPPKDVDIILRTDSDGWYTIAGLGDDRPVQLTANLRGYAPVVRKANSGALPTIVLGAGRRLEGFVTDASGTALPGVAVFVVVSGHDYFVSPPDLEGPVTATGVFDKMLFGRALTDASGRYSIEGLDVPGVYTVVAIGDPYGPARNSGVRLRRSK